MSSLNPIDRVFDAIVPRAVDAIDMNEVHRSGRHQPSDRGVDLDAVLARLDMDALLERIDIQKIIDQVDIQKIIDRVDIDGIIKRVDINGIIGQVDIDSVIGQVDVASLVKKAGIDDIVSSASRGVITRMLDLVRRQLVGVDAVLIGATNKVFRRPSEQAEVASGTVTGRLAGGISRFVAFLADAFTISFSYGVMVALVVYLVELLGASNAAVKGHGLAWALGYVGFGFLYYWIGAGDHRPVDRQGPGRPAGRAHGRRPDQPGPGRGAHLRVPVQLHPRARPDPHRHRQAPPGAARLGRRRQGPLRLGRPPGRAARPAHGLGPSPHRRDPACRRHLGTTTWWLPKPSS